MAPIEFAFLPDFPQPMSALVLFGVLLLLGLVGGALARMIALPAITGYILVGMLLGQSGVRLLTPELLAQARVFVDISLGLILFDLGRRLDFNWLRNDRSLLFSSISECVISFTLMFLALSWFGFPKLIAALAAAIGISASPGVVLLVAQEQRAEGQVTERALNLVAMNSVYAFIAATMLLSALHFEYHASAFTILLHPLYLLAGSTILGVVAWYIAVQFGRRLGKREDRQFVMLIGLIILTVGAANVLKLSVLLALLVFGVLVRNFDKRHYVVPLEMAGKGELFFIVLFVVTGAVLDARQLLAGGGVAAAYVAARFVGKMAGIAPFSILSGLTAQKSAWLGLTLTPMAGFAVVMVQDIWGLYPDLDLQAFAVLTSAVVILEIVGPIAVQYALKRSGEAYPGKR